jgi:hypothetical protein
MAFWIRLRLAPRHPTPSFPFCSPLPLLSLLHCCIVTSLLAPSGHRFSGMNSETCLLLLGPFLPRPDRFQSHAKENLTAEWAQKNRAAEGEPSTLHGLESNQ